MVNEKPTTRNAQHTTQSHALRITLYAFNPQLTTHNPQPDFGANAPPTHQFYALRFTHHALRIASHAHFPKSPILPSNPLNHASQITHQMAIK